MSSCPDSARSSGSAGSTPASAAARRRVNARAGLVALPLAAMLMTAAPACSSNTSNSASGGSSPTSSAQAVKFAKTRFAANVALAGGAAYQWIYKPFKAGTFKKGAHGRTGALIKGGLAGLFTYNRLHAALNDAKGDPTLSKLVAPLTKSVDDLKAAGSKLRHGDASAADMSSFTNTINQVKGAASKDGVSIKDKVPSLSQLSSGS